MCSFSYKSSTVSSQKGEGNLILSGGFRGGGEKHSICLQLKELDKRFVERQDLGQA